MNSTEYLSVAYSSSSKVPPFVFFSFPRLVAKYVCRQRALKVFNDFELHLSQLSAFSHFARYALHFVFVALAVLVVVVADVVVSFVV